MTKEEETKFINEIIGIAGRYRFQIHIPQTTEENKNTVIKILSFDLKKQILVIDPKN